MTWAEFRIRLHGFKRENERKLYNMREMAWVTYISPHLDPKKMKKSKEAFWPIHKKSPKIEAERMKATMERAMKEYLNKKNNG